jgi:hypothetical protein
MGWGMLGRRNQESGIRNRESGIGMSDVGSRLL